MSKQKYNIEHKNYAMPFLEQQNWEEYDMSDLDEEE